MTTPDQTSKPQPVTRKYRRKAEIIEATQFLGGKPGEMFMQWPVLGNGNAVYVDMPCGCCEGCTVTVFIGDFVVRRSDGTYDRLSTEIIAECFEPVIELTSPAVMDVENALRTIEEDQNRFGPVPKKPMAEWVIVRDFVKGQIARMIAPEQRQPEYKISDVINELQGQIEDIEKVLPWQARVRVERDELAEKTEKLRLFLQSDKFAPLPAVDRRLLQEQYLCMVTYLSTLDIRLSRMSEGKEEA